MAEQLDYMSDEFITKCLDSNDVRPGLLKTRNERRQHDLMKKKENTDTKKKPTPQSIQLKILEEGLDQPIDSGNKGFSMLQKMGFKSGMGLGKNNGGIVEPISISIKNDRKGLGHKKNPKPTKLSKEKNERHKISADDFRAFQSKKNKEREITSDLRKSQRICRELDEKLNKTKPEELWFWPEVSETGADNTADVTDDDDDEYSDAEKLEALTRYLRLNYFYCVWCKVQYNDEKDLEDCPGASRDDH